MGTCPAAGAADPATILCTSCGLCCTGAMHHAVLLVDRETDTARALGLQVDDGIKPVFALPCPKLEGTLCGVYERRPSSCGYYRCQLLRNLDEGKVDLEDAMAKARVARAQLADVQEMLPPGMSLRRARAIATGREASDDASPELRLRITALTHYLDRYFMNDDDGKYFVASDVSPKSEPA